MADDFISALGFQTTVNELGVLHHNTDSRILSPEEAVIEQRPTLPGSTKTATGDYGRGAFVHRDIPLYVSEDKIATTLASTTITANEINPHAAASFGILDSGSNRITIVQNAGSTENNGNIYFGTDEAAFQVNQFADSGNTYAPSAVVTDRAFSVSTDGLHLYALDGEGEIHQYSFGTAYDISTLLEVATQSIPTGANPAQDLHIHSDGTKIWTLADNNIGARTVYEYSLSTAYDITSISDPFDDSFAVTSQVAQAETIHLTSDGSKMYILDSSNDNIEQYTLSTPADLTTAGYDTKTLDPTGEVANVEGFTMNPDGDTVFVLGTDNVVYEYTLGTPYDLSTESYASRSLDLSSGFGNPSDIVVSSTGDSLYSYSTSTGTIYELNATDVFTKVTDADSPGTPSETVMIRGCPVLNGYVFAGDSNGNIYNADNGSVSAWTATSVIAAERKPDFGCALVEHKDHVVYIGTRSIEFFYDGANINGSPLERRQDVYYNVGCVFPNSVTQKGDIVYFIGTDQQGDTDIYVLDQFRLSPLKNEYIKSLLRDVETPLFSNPYTTDPTLFKQLLVAYTTPDGGPALAMTINGKSYNYNLKTGQFSKWYTGEAPASATGLFTSSWATEELLPIMSIYSSTAMGSPVHAILSNGYTTEFVYNSDLQDVGGTTAAACFFYTPKWNAGTLNRKKINYYYLHHYPNLDSSVTSSNVTIEWVDLEDADEIGAALTDADFAQARTVSTNYSNARLYRCGKTRERVHKITLTPGKSQVIKGLELNFEILRG